MRQVAKYASPIIVLLGILIFRDNQSSFVVPTLGLIGSLSVLYLLCQPLRENVKTSGILLFWLAPLALLWLLSERREGRDINSTSITIELALAGIGTVLLVSKEGLKKSDWSLFLAIFLTWAVAYLSGSSGGADQMVPFFDFLGLSVDQLNNLIIVIRKTIHVSFYGTLGYLFLTYLSDKVADKTSLFWFPFLFCLAISIADEGRQSLMPNRGGSVTDVILDMSATLFILFVVIRKRTKKTP
jgi:VanZ family protein